jgi:glycerol-3-phosphate dehydrogenase (NAD+)
VQGVSAVEAFHELLRQPSLSVMHPELNKPVAPVELCPLLRALYKILIQRNAPPGAILQALRDENMYDPRHRIEMDAVYIPQLLRAEKEPPLKIVSNLGSKEFGSRPSGLVTPFSPTSP